MAWVIERRRSGRDRPLPASSRAPESPLFPVFVALATVSLAIAGGFALAGAWPVLPFAGIELAALAWAMRRFGGSARNVAAVPSAPTFHCAARNRRHRPATRIRMTNLRRKPF
jgi:uncharacterized membrane protein